MTHRAQMERKSAPLASDFGKEMVKRHFADLAEAIYEAIPKYVRGPKKGQPKGWVVWDKVTRGGWVADGPSYHGSPNGHVELPGTRNVRIVLDYNQVYGSSRDYRHAIGPGQMSDDWSPEYKLEYVTRGIGQMAAAAKAASRGW